MRSMTGFGVGRASESGFLVAVELRSVNHRYCDIRLRMPSELSGLDSRVEALIRRKVERGRIDGSVTVSAGADAATIPDVDWARARGYRDRILALAETLGLEPNLSLETLVGLPGVLRGGGESRIDPTGVQQGLEAAAVQALDALMAMREDEGRRLELDLVQRLATVESLAKQIEILIPTAIEERRSRLEGRLQELLGAASMDPMRLAQEVAILVDRSDVSEELTRLSSHVEQLRATFGAAEGVGRRVDFLLQELNREANTLGSKTSHAAISHLVVELKVEIERMREQAQNLE